MNQEEFNQVYGKVKCEKKKSKNGGFSLVRAVKSFIPILEWLPNYNIKQNLHGDIIAGMAYASLAGVPPIHGLYSSFFASIIYMFFGTSRHISIGVFAVVSMMTGATRIKFVNDEIVNNNLTVNQGNVEVIDSLTLTSTITFTVGLIQIIMGLFRLSFLTNYMSDALVSGFTTGAACHVFMSQLNKVFGYKIPKHSGIGMLIFMLKDIIMNLYKTNFITLGLATFGLIFLSLGRDYLNPWFRKYSLIPIPLELILVIITTIASSIFDFKEKFNVPIVDNIPQGFPLPKWPNLKLVPLVYIDCIGISIVCYMFVMSMAKLFAKKHKYPINSNQELYACGLMSLLSSVFPVYPTGASLSRSSVCEMSGVKTQLNVVFSSLLLVVVIMWLGVYLEPLPMCILASIVIISLKSLFMQFKDLGKLWRISKYDFSVWIIAFASTAFGTVTFGLAVSLGFILLTVVMQEQFPQMIELGSSENRKYFRSIDNYSNLSKIKDNVTILKFESPLHFANSSRFVDKVCEVYTQFDNHLSSMKIIKSNEKLDEKLDENEEPIKECLNKDKKNFIILDCSSISYLDTMGLDALKKVEIESNLLRIEFYLTNLNENIITLFDKCNENEVPKKNNIFPTVNDALEYIENFGQN
ncbi:FI18412p1 [Strongyloides ratti]|uniref:FI18412p1 n=1 Tax=Strongyloides ratti TaxID=34506 RepID=A0A090LCU6_STRRB|nr:FI18412p1 [Strongyloides ratti]CEF67582.1 FI18412p1 [Strongyloides ratti]